ncbi:ApeA N-terminal domain 1-containing protein [Streptomyces blattellae]|uniref:ApeA N-terminal domain 1-containing protein n=1 Tax=Streptomyces blattellae TaxID=2569855 RepID=UPI0012B8D664|nr:hypothetical protein [Streptomyces blattellae]
MADDPLNLDEAGEWAGLWWLPEDPDEQVPGVLRYDPESGLSLSLIGAFEDRVGRPDDVAHAVEYLVNADYVTGTVLPVDGGLTLPQ